MVGHAEVVDDDACGFGFAVGTVDSRDRLQELGLLMWRSRYMTCSTGASKPVMSIDFTIRKARGSSLLGS
jgi:hypothetical protein